MPLLLFIAHLASTASMTLPVAGFCGETANNDPLILFNYAISAIIDPVYECFSAVNARFGTAGIYRGREAS